jgi:hypothetical protein
MKKIIILLIVVAFSTVTVAQRQNVRMFHIGGNMSQFSGKDIHIGDLKPGYQVGFTSHFGSFMSLEPGIFLINKGAGYGDNITNLNYLQVPINLKFNIGVGDLRFVFGAGVYGSIGLWGNVRDGVFGKKLNSVKFYEKDGTWNFYDFGGQVFAGILFGRFGVNVGWQPGLISIQEHSTIYNNSVYLNLTYMLSHIDR